MTDSTMASSFFERFMNWSVRYEGSTRAAAIVRIGFPVVLWSLLGEFLLLYKVQDEPQMLLASLLFFAGTASMMLGYRSRLSCLLTGAVMSYFYLYRGLWVDNDDWRMFPQYWSPPLFLALTDCGRSLSVDRWLALRHARASNSPAPREQGNLMGLRLMAIHVSLIYLFGALDKSDAAWFAGERVDRIWMAYYGSSDYPDNALAPWLFKGAALVSFSAEVLLGIGLWLDRWRKYLVVIGIGLHSAFYLSMWVSSFSWMMWLCYLAFFPPGQIHRWVDELLGIESSAASSGG